MSKIVEQIKQWRDQYISHPDLMKGLIVCYVDSADIGFRQGLELEARRQNLINVRFEPSTKISTQSRVDFIRLIMAYGEYYVSNLCPNLIRETKNSRHGEKGEVREDLDDHALTASEYAWVSIINRLKRWKTFKAR